jgi:hypothetical protein
MKGECLLEASHLVECLREVRPDPEERVAVHRAASTFHALLPHDNRLPEAVPTGHHRSDVDVTAQQERPVVGVLREGHALPEQLESLGVCAGPGQGEAEVVERPPLELVAACGPSLRERGLQVRRCIRCRPCSPAEPTEAMQQRGALLAWADPLEGREPGAKGSAGRLGIFSGLVPRVRLPLPKRRLQPAIVLGAIVEGPQHLERLVDPRAPRLVVLVPPAQLQVLDHPGPMLGRRCAEAAALVDHDPHPVARAFELTDR